MVLRPQPGASATLARAAGMGLPAIAIHLFSVEPLEWQPPATGTFDGLLLTSANAPREAGPQLDLLRGLPVYAVGEATGAAARAAGLHVVEVGRGGVKELLAGVPRDLRLLHLCGADRTAEPTPVSVDCIPVYRAAPIDAPTGLDRLPGSVALVHSPRAGRRLAEVAGERQDVRVAAISKSAADACGTGWAALEAAPEPTDAALLSLAARLCQQSDPK
ncbi:uroporphyrinogen-III synthase [Sphingomonas sp. BN140010]|uniref:Uroporphyrinogen-III synthase n=1 Tax=Sphingomonas arvum TaxID=2992113 RepID=A0ABT3JFB4_9SPHN|nr:uroporphyrinogen-III synthase [Sphingomonas sp. BN140010]MCW3797767.1 uroporphyrinogen-III synthase [Sphingomonas sp. BN140010]